MYNFFWMLLENVKAEKHFISIIHSFSHSFIYSFKLILVMLQRYLCNDLSLKTHFLSNKWRQCCQSHYRYHLRFTAISWTRSKKAPPFGNEHNNNKKYKKFFLYFFNFFVGIVIVVVVITLMIQWHSVNFCSSLAIFVSFFVKYSWEFF